VALELLGNWQKCQFSSPVPEFFGIEGWMRVTGAAWFLGTIVACGGVAHAASSTTVSSGFKLPDTVMIDGGVGAWTERSTAAPEAQDLRTFPAGFWEVLAPRGTSAVYLSHGAFPGTLGQILDSSLTPGTLSTPYSPAADPQSRAAKTAQGAFDSLSLTDAVPEPASLLLLGTGLCLAARHARRRRKKS
jgi:PEP-CTERM motif-containing protein